MSGTVTQAAIQTLTAEVKTLQVGNRQVTLSVFRQLDEIPMEHLTPFGRVNVHPQDTAGEHLRFVGVDERTGSLAAAIQYHPGSEPYLLPEPEYVIDVRDGIHHGCLDENGRQARYHPELRYVRLEDGTAVRLSSQTGFWPSDDETWAAVPVNVWYWATSEARRQAEQQVAAQKASNAARRQNHERALAEYRRALADWNALNALPLIVLAGLR